MTLSIVIVSYNAREDLERCLESLHTAPPATPHDITVVDNASTEGGLDRDSGAVAVNPGNRPRSESRLRRR